MLPAPRAGITSAKILTLLISSQQMNRLSLQFMKMSLQIAKCREIPVFPETVSLLTASSARQSGLRDAKCAIEVLRL
jgi:hypothetical protein